ncbi:diguanylate cyclase [Azonexus sp. R2A61]|uniref:GGDEF domain-containing protein n=1 Tax=Azonexus sp. R2A61 TaxID=2744443 RepID=UPI001F4428DB|nr:GGDEF domain-containing protein [Azonexus sp. R2A61]
MNATANPFEIARDTLKQLAARRIAPTPDNYQTLYHEIAGTKPADADFPERHLRSLAAALPRNSPDQLRLARQLDDAIKQSNWEDYRKHLAEFIGTLIEQQKLGWADLITDLLRQWEAKHPGLTAARKREALEHVLAGSSANPELLYGRLQNLLKSWGQGQGQDRTETLQTEIQSDTPSTAAGQQAQLRELLAFTLDTAIASQLAEHPPLASDAQHLASDIRRVTTESDLREFHNHLKRFAFKLELLAEDQAELRHSLLGLLQLLVSNIHELVVDDRWLHGQIEIVRDIIDKPLSQRSLDDAERHLKEVLFKQSQLKTSLFEARNAIKQMLAGFVDQLADFADATSEYHDKIDACAVKVSAANDIGELEEVLAEVMRETRNIQFNAQRSHDELRSTQEKAQKAEARIRELEKELEETSDLVRHDQLTGVLNRRGLEDMFNKEVARATRHDTALCIALLDIDNFKKLNDSMGHDAGDQALIHLAKVCRDTLRPQDTVARYGGEEFIILLPETLLDDAAHVLTRLQRELTKRFFLHGNEKVLITFSAGVTQMADGDDQGSVVKRADEAMYEAKQTGKNRVISR